MDPDGASPGRVVIRLDRENEPPFGWEGPSAEDGTLTVARLPQGDYRMSMRSREGDYLGGQKLTWTGRESPITLRIETAIEPFGGRADSGSVRIRTLFHPRMAHLFEEYTFWKKDIVL